MTAYEVWCSRGQDDKTKGNSKQFTLCLPIYPRENFSIHTLGKPKQSASSELSKQLLVSICWSERIAC